MAGIYWLGCLRLVAGKEPIADPFCQNTSPFHISRHTHTDEHTNAGLRLTCILQYLRVCNSMFISINSPVALRCSQRLGEKTFRSRQSYERDGGGKCGYVILRTWHTLHINLVSGRQVSLPVSVALSVAWWLRCVRLAVSFVYHCLNTDT